MRGEHEKKKKKKLPQSCVFVLFLQRIFVQAVIPPLWHCLPISARSRSEAFPTRTLRFESDCLWISRRGRAQSRAKATRAVRARQMRGADARSERFPRRRAPDPKRGVLSRDGDAGGCRANGYGHRDLAWRVAGAPSAPPARGTRHEPRRNLWCGHVVGRLCEPRPFARHRLCATHAGRWADGRRDHALAGRRVGRRRAGRDGTRSRLRSSTVLLVRGAGCAEQNL